MRSRSADRPPSGVSAAIQRLLAARGLYVFRRLPHGVDVGADLARLVPGFRPALVFDVGANVGQSVPRLRDAFAAATIHCFEPGQRAFATLETAAAGDARVRCHRLALGADPGPGRLERRGSFGEKSVLSVGEGDDAREPVAIDTLDAFCAREGIEHVGYLKIDTEGHDLLVLQGASGLLARGVDAIEVETGMGHDNALHAPLARFVEILAPHGHRLFGLYEQTHEWPTGAPHLRRANAVFLREDVR
ncbi:MAG TPA: FkbM family methyltransferase [Myxococcota bacterium]|nr:FkbM family methyltransferase [Myxococcota bacterium]